MNLQEAQAPIDREIALALVQATPETWDRAEVKLERRADVAVESIRIEISNPDGRRDVVSPTQ
ncbi:hypothetical protein [Caulobacter endophyticus]|uniref:hypothetical protein n=1 Tax=Caulobacter endophyticus TaxID=2172652 RepID=UPI00240FD1BA|nr:hypothetical protein [Caulobacter endophyticus]MDG2530399.1 hypothetical protein [Caulobacter endophyticus]